MRMNTAEMAPDSGVRAPLSSLTSDWACPPLTGKAAAESRREVGGGKRQELLVGIKASAVLGGKGPADRRRLHGSEKEAGKSERQQRVQVGPVNIGNAQGREPLRHFAEKIDALGIQAE